MKKEEIINYKIDSDVLKKYVETINSIKEPMSKIKDELNQISKPMKEQLKSINAMSNAIKELSIKYPNKQKNIYRYYKTDNGY